MKSNTLYRVLGIMGGLYGLALLALLTMLFIDLSANAEDFANPDPTLLVFALALLVGGSAILYFVSITLPKHRWADHRKQLILDFPDQVIEPYKVTTRLWISGVVSIIASFIGAIGFAGTAWEVIARALEHGRGSVLIGSLMFGLPSLCAMALLVYSIRTMTMKKVRVARLKPQTA